MPEPDEVLPVEPPRCRPRVDQLIFEIASATLSDRTAAAAAGRDFIRVLSEGVNSIRSVEPELDRAAQLGDLLPLVLSYLELSCFTKLAWGGLAHNDEEPPNWTFLRLFKTTSTDIPLESVPGDVAAVPVDITSFIEVFEAKHGRYGLDVLLIAVRQFIARHDRSSEARMVNVRGGYAGMNDAYLRHVFCSNLLEFACCVSLHIGDTRSFSSFWRGKGDTRRLAASAMALLGAGQAVMALRWLELEPRDGDLGYHWDDDSVLNLRVLAARRANDRDATLRHLTAAYLETFEKRYFSEIVEMFEGQSAISSRTQLISLAESAAENRAAKAFKLLLDEQEWAALERLQARHHGKEFLLVSISGDLEGLDGLIEACRNEAPCVSSRLRHLK